MIIYRSIKKIFFYIFLILISSSFDSTYTTASKTEYEKLFPDETEESLKQRKESSTSIMIYSIFYYIEDMTKQIKFFLEKENIKENKVITDLEKIVEESEEIIDKTPYKVFMKNGNPYFYYLNNKNDVITLYNTIFPLFLKAIEIIFQNSLHKKIEFEKTEDLEVIRKNTSYLILFLDSIINEK